MGNRRTWLIAGLALAMVVAVLAYRLSQAPDSKVTVRSIPSDLTLTLDGQSISATGAVMVDEGRHTLVAERNGFESRIETILVKDGEPLFVRMYLRPSGSVGRTWEREHAAEALEAAEAATADGEVTRRLTRKYPVLAELPYIGPGFSMNYGPSKVDPDNRERIGIYVKVFGPDGRDKALEWMHGHGYDPAKYELIYTK